MTIMSAMATAVGTAAQPAMTSIATTALPIDLMAIPGLSPDAQLRQAHAMYGEELAARDQHPWGLYVVAGVAAVIAGYVGGRALRRATRRTR